MGRAPVVWLWAGFAVAVIGLLVVGVLGQRPLFAIIGWLLVGPVAISFVALFITREAKAKDASIYAAPTWVPWAFRLLIVLCLLGAAAAAARIGLWVGRW